MFGPSETLSISAACTHIEELTGHRPHPATVTRWALSGRLPFRRVGRRLLVTRTAVRELLEAFNAPPAPVGAAAREPRADVQQAGAEAHARIAGMEG